MDISRIEDYVGDCKGHAELDSHADTCVGGATCVVDYYTGNWLNLMQLFGFLGQCSHLFLL